MGFLLLLTACKQQPSANSEQPIANSQQPNAEAKAMLQGVWLDGITEEPVMKAEGDTIYFADADTQPAYFTIVGDSLRLGSNTYLITQQTEHNFCFQNHAGDEVQLVKSDDPQLPPFASEQPQFADGQQPIASSQQPITTDSVIYYSGQRYHWYVTVNPTRNRVLRTIYTPDGVAVEKEFYDNIIHVSLFRMNQRLFTRDFNKRAFSDNVPEDFLAQSILGNIRYSHADARGLHFYATVCLPDDEQCYMIETLINYDGQLSLKLME